MTQPSVLGVDASSVTRFRFTERPGCTVSAFAVPYGGGQPDAHRVAAPDDPDPDPDPATVETE